MENGESRSGRWGIEEETGRWRVGEMGGEEEKRRGKEDVVGRKRGERIRWKASNRFRFCWNTSCKPAG